MKRTILLTALAVAVFSATPTIAEQAPVTGKGTQEKEAASNVQDFDKRMAQVQENIKKMQEQMDKIGQSKDLQERQKLLQDHWVTMQDNMRLMRGMWWRPGGGMRDPMMGGHMMGGPMMGWGQMGDYYSKLTPEQKKQRQYMMDRYLGMQYLMMDQMMQHQYYMWMR